MFSVLALLVLCAPGEQPVDRVELQNGKIVEGRIVFEDATSIVVRNGSRDVEYERKDITKFDSRLSAHREFLERWIALGPTDETKLYDLLAMATRAGLEEDKRLLAWWILSRLPKSEDAHLTLGHEEKDGVWFVRDGSRRIAWDDLPKLRTNWKDAWEIPSQHYLVRSNLRLSDTVDLAFGLECAHAAFYAQFGQSLRLLDTVEPLVAHIHADKKSFPEMTGSSSAYFEPTARVLHVDASNGIGKTFDETIVVHEACHQLTDATARPLKGSAGYIPAWLDEGLAEYLRAGCLTDIARWRYDEEGRMASHFDAHARAKRPFDLSGLLVFQSSDFQASSKQDLKYAQAYTLVAWAMRADDGKWKPRFFDFLRGAYKGKASPTDFKTAMGLKDDAIEKAWLTYSKLNASSK